MRTAQKALDQRHQQILELLEKNGEFRSESFAREQGISIMTVRRDLQLLEERGLLRRVHGGAVPSAAEDASGESQAEVMKCRDAISRYASFFVNNGDRLFINGSRTALNLLKYVQDKSVTVYTNNGWAILEEFPAGVALRLIGGEVNNRIMVGERTMRTILDLRAEKTFIGCAAVYDDAKFSYSIPTEIGINEAMIGRTIEHLYILADHTKLQFSEARDDAYGSCSYDRQFTLITDSKANPKIIENLLTYGMKIIQVPVE
jgi:DeoR/GlpR family transcriptional regulator of sugar metabolism